METKTYTACNVCGGCDYQMEGGFYYCTECHTQTQELREEVFDIGDPTSKNVSQIKVPKEKPKSVKRWSSWEGYNLILIGLVNELITLDVSPKIKFTTLQLWTAYLSAIQVAFISTDNDTELPRLSAIYKRNDAETVYGLRPRKRVRSVSTVSSKRSESGSSVSKIGQARRITKTKRQLATAEYQTSRENINLDSSSYTEYSSAKSSSDASFVSKYLQFNDEAKKQRLRVLAPDHYEDHCMDDNLKCHRIGARAISSDYLHGTHHLTLTKLYTIIYLALLVNKLEIQVGDIIRFIRDGYLSYTNVKHLFPEEMALDAKYQQLFEFRQPMFTHENFRMLTAKVAKLIGVQLDKCTNIEYLCRRYLQELYLPEKLMEIIKDLIDIAPPEMSFMGTESTIPNYEGRAMAYILFTLKLYFGLDDVTEHQISNLAKRLNQMNLIGSRTTRNTQNESFQLYSTGLEDDLKSFDIPPTSNFDSNQFFIWDEWVEFIECRKLIISKYHIPTQQRYYPYDMTNGELFVNFWNEQRSKTDFYEENQCNAKSFIFKNIFEKLNSLSDSKETTKIDFKASLTPFSTYLARIMQECDVPSILHKKIPDFNIEFILNPDEFIKTYNLKNVKKIKMRTFQDVTTVPPFLKDQTRLNNSTVQIEFDENEFDGDNNDNISVNVEFEQRESESLQCSDGNSSWWEFEYSTIDDDNLKEHENPLTFYYPYLYYWIYFGSIIKLFKNHDFVKIRANFSDSFNWLLTECSNVIEMMPKDLYQELVTIETYLGYIIKNTQPSTYGVTKSFYKKLIKKTVKNW